MTALLRTLARSSAALALPALAGASAVVTAYALARGALGLARERRARAAACATPAGVARPHPYAGPRVLLVRPCAGDEPALERALGSLAQAVLPAGARLEVLHAVARRGDPAAPVAERACALLRDRGLDARVVYTAPRGPNHKAGQLAAALRAARSKPQLVLVADSDVDLAGYDLDALTAPLRDDRAEHAPRCAARWAPPFETASETAGDRASRAVLTASLQSFATLAPLDPHALVGKLFAVRADALDACGGFDALRCYLGEDVELARRLRAAGRTVVAAAPARSLAQGRTRRDAVERYARWMQVVRAQRPALLVTYPVLFFPTLTALGLAALAAPLAPGLALAGLVATALPRLALARGAARRLGLAHPTLRAAALDAARAELTLAASFALALTRDEVRWRGRALRFTPTGALADDAPEPVAAPLATALS